MRSKILFWIVVPLSLVAVGEFFLSWWVALGVFGALFLLTVVAGCGVRAFLVRVWRVIWITFPVLLFTLRTKQSGLFLGWFYLDPLVDYGVLILRLSNFTLAFWLLQRLWYLPLKRYQTLFLMRVFWRAFGLVMEMWNQILLWPRQRFSLQDWIEKTYENGKPRDGQVSDKNIDNLYTNVKE